MALGNELSREIATAILTARDRSAQRLSELKDIVLRVHSALQEMAERDRTPLPQRSFAPAKASELPTREFTSTD
jgi:hypothetical protein